MFQRLVLLVLVGCGAGEGSDVGWEAMSLTDAGTFCLSAGEGDVATVNVNAGICLSSSCSRAASGSCEAVYANGVVTVTSQFDWEEATGEVSCTDDCGLLAVSCEVVGLPESGQVEVVLGGESLLVDLPVTGECEAFGF